MTINEFMRKIKVRFPNSQNDYVLEDIKQLIESHNYSDDKIDTLYMILTSQHDSYTLPTPKKINEYIAKSQLSLREQTHIELSEAEIINKLRQFDVGKLFLYLKDIRFRLWSNVSVKIQEKISLNIYDNFLYNYQARLDNGVDANTIATYAKRDREIVEAGQRIALYKGDAPLKIDNDRKGKQKIKEVVKNFNECVTL